MNAKVWKVLDTRTGKFHHEGGSKRKLGKLYQRLSDLVSHIQCLLPHNVAYGRLPSGERVVQRIFTREQMLDRLPEQDVVVEYELVEVKRTPLREFALERVKL